MPSWLTSLLAACLIQGLQSNSLFLASLCKGHQCETPERPMQEYDSQRNRCMCGAHPCWDDNGVTHVCSGDDFPFLTFVYKEDGMHCSCGSHATIDSVFIADEKCRSKKCTNEEHPVLDVDNDGVCTCRPNPCWDDNGKRHSCGLMFPILSYRQDSNGKMVCECKPKLHKPGDLNETAEHRVFSSIPQYKYDDPTLPTRCEIQTCSG